MSPDRGFVHVTLRTISHVIVITLCRHIEEHGQPCDTFPQSNSGGRGMDGQPSEDEIALKEVVATIVAAYVTRNNLNAADLGPLIRETYKSVRGLTGPEIPAAAEVEVLHPAVPVRKSITPDYLVCLDDGRKLKSLRRHLATLGMTPDQYRRKWNLPADYPMVAPSYSEKRSAIAKSFSLGRQAAAKPRPRTARLG